MNLGIDTRYDELSLAVSVTTITPCKIRIKVFDEKNPRTVFTDRYKTVKGNYTFFVRMPISSNKVILTVYNEAVGNKKKGEDGSFMVTEVKKVPLQKRTDVGDIKNYTVSSFVDFAQKFSFNASYLDANQTYQSQDGKFLIEYLPYITNSKTDKKLSTPARISKINGKIQVSKEAFDNYTVPMRMAILLHEFSHFYLNENMDDEIEADLNGLLIYLGLGYPRIEAYQGFLEVFQDTPSQQNKNRYDIIDKFIRDFENQNMVLN